VTTPTCAQKQQNKKKKTRKKRTQGHPLLRPKDGAIGIKNNKKKKKKKKEKKEKKREYKLPLC
jgi:hypothetical protein